MRLFDKIDLINALLSAALSVILTPFFQYGLERTAGQPLIQMHPVFNLTISPLSPPTNTGVTPGDSPIEGVSNPTGPEPRTDVTWDYGDGRIRSADLSVQRSDGTAARFRVVLLNAEHHWPLGGVNRVMAPDGGQVDLHEFLDSSGLRQRIEGAQDIIAVGAASCEEAPHGASEWDRARDRAQQLIHWVRQADALGPNTRLYDINLGRFHDPDCRDKTPYQTRNQRRSLLVAVMEKQRVTTQEQLAGLLKEELFTRDRLQIDFPRYRDTRFVLTRRD